MAISRERTSEKLAKAAAEARLKHPSVSAAAKAMGVHRTTLQHHLRKAEEMGIIKPTTVANPSRWRPGADIVAARKAEFERVKASRPSLANTIFLPDDGPFCLVALGDEHLDNPGTDLEAFERWIGVLDRTKHITGISMGDMLDNWVRPLAHLYGSAETPAPEGWILLEHYMDQIGEDMDISVGGNHDAWSGASDVLGMIMDKHGVLHRNHSIRVEYKAPSGRTISINARHKWPGRSMWNDVHGIKRAARMGIRDTILLGGHTHVSGESMEKDPMTGRISFCYQVASFKTYDDYADENGFTDRQSSPALAMVIDPRRPDTDPELVKHFYEPEAAVAYLKMLRRGYTKAA